MGDDTAAPRAVHQAAHQAAWSRYWQTGALHSCGGTFDGNYAGAIDSFWRQAFADLHAGQRMLDIGTGNGPLLKLLLQVHPDDPTLCADGVDAADIAPSWAADLAIGCRDRLRFHPRTRAEDLPFPAGSFHLVTSQYGMEYAKHPQALDEALRVLHPEGHLRMVLHHDGGRPVELAREELAHIEWLTRPGGWFDAANGMVDPMAMAATPEGRARLASDPLALQARSRFDQQVAALQVRANQSLAPDILVDASRWQASVFRQAVEHGPSAGHAASQTLGTTLADIRCRLEDLVGHALSAGAVQRWCARLAASGRQPQVAMLHEQGHLMGWALRA